ncbi:MAG: FIST C-terminal domain-containing protein [Saprospiraceae bacterium]|jgi:hypothetical protein|nr:FIST C-terminal domain-containing protein [Saprospiraceae bacterium]
MRAKSIQGSSISQIKNALEESISDGFIPKLAFLFISIKQDRKSVCEIFNNMGIDIIGATSSGEFIAGHQSTGEIVAMLLDIPKNAYCILFEEIGDKSIADTSTKMAHDALLKFSNPAFILLSTLISADGKMVDGATLIQSIENIVGPHVNLFGGMAGDDITLTGTYVFTNNQSTDYGMVSLVLNEDKISLQGMAISGWKPMGIFRTVTKSEANLLYTLDDQPAIEIYLRLLGKDVSSTKGMVEFYHAMGVHYPFQIEREGREPMMCNPIGYNEEKDALICESDVLQGSRLRFSYPPDFDIIESVIKKASDLKKEKDAEADALLIFSCAGRLSALGPMAREENEGLVEVWEAPMAGFFTYGEFGKGENGKHEFHSTTNSWVVLKEK